MRRIEFSRWWNIGRMYCSDGSKRIHLGPIALVTRLPDAMMEDKK